MMSTRCGASLEGKGSKVSRGSSTWSPKLSEDEAFATVRCSCLLHDLLLRLVWPARGQHCLTPRTLSTVPASLQERNGITVTDNCDLCMSRKLSCRILGEGAVGCIAVAGCSRSIPVGAALTV